MITRNVKLLVHISRIKSKTGATYIRSVSDAATVLATRTSVPVLDSHISYLDTGKANDHSSDVAVFLHGNPTQAYLWRNVIPHVEPVARCIAPDLIGMGQSGKIKSEYRFVDHYRYLNAWLEKLDLPKKLHFVVQDWGSVLGFHWCNLHRERVKSIAFMEAIPGPMFKTWDDFPANFRQVFQDLRSPKGEEMVIEQNAFVEKLLPAGVLRELTEEEKATYVEPFRKRGESRRPCLTWPREIPVLSEGPEDVCKIVSDYQKWLENFANDVPKLYVHAEPGFFAPMLKEAVKKFENTKTVTVKGHHFVQEDSPTEVGRAVKEFIENVLYK